MYTVHGDQAELVARSVFDEQPAKWIWYWGGSGIDAAEEPGKIPTLVMPQKAYERAVVSLLTSEKRGVCLMEREGDRYTRTKTATPGNPYAFSDSTVADPPTVAVIYGTDGYEVVMAYSDGRDGLGLVSFQDSRRYPVLSSALCQISAKEAIIAGPCDLGACLESQALLHARNDTLFRGLGSGWELGTDTAIGLLTEETAHAFRSALLRALVVPRGQEVALRAIRALADYFGLGTGHSASKVTTRLAFSSCRIGDAVLITNSDLAAMQMTGRAHRPGQPVSLRRFLDSTVTVWGRRASPRWIWHPPRGLDTSCMRSG